MSSRVFQSIVLQMKECTDRVIGVIDDQGTVVSCNQLTWIGEKWEGAASALNVNESAVVIYGDKTFKPLVSRGSHYDYAAFVQGSDEQAKLICSMVTVALNSAKAYYEEKHDKTAFVKAIISDNILLGDIYVRAKELHFASEALRAVFLVRQVGSAEIAAVDVVQSLFSDSQEDFVISINETDIAVIKTLTEGGDGKEIYRIAKSIEDALAQNLKIKTTIGIGTVVSHIRDLARAYKEAGVAIDVGKVFDTEKTIITYENLGIGRLIYQLPTVMCGTPIPPKPNLTPHLRGPGPVQVKLLPIADRHIDYLNTVKAKLEAAGIRCEVDDRSEKIGFKIRSAQMEKVPYMLVAGDKDIEAGTVSVRSRKDGDEGASSLEDFIARITEEIATKAK